MRVGYRCTLCGRVTCGPDGDKGFVCIGDAAHITAASPKGPRYDISLTSEERKSINNGIWLCKTCAYIIDRDYKQYSIHRLQTIKANMELYTQAELNNSDNPCLPDWVCRKVIKNIMTIMYNVMYIKLHSGLDKLISKDVYKSCIEMKEASMKLMELEALNHFQMMRLNIDWIIVEIDKMLPDISTNDDNKHIINCRYIFS